MERKLTKFIIKGIATFFFVGYLPIAPGTWGSAVGVAVYLLLRDNIFIYLLVLAMLFFLGFYICGKAEVIFGKKDDKRIVIDEVCGLLLVFFLIPPHKFYMLIGFFFFRLFDILKIYPAMKLEKLPCSIGIMTDDVIAALYTYIIIKLLIIPWKFCS
jgi:phosphatidylglycerophosphatase A